MTNASHVEACKVIISNFEGILIIIFEGIMKKVVSKITTRHFK